MPTDRRNFIRDLTAGAAGAAAAASTTVFAQPVALNPNAKAVMPNGELKDRKEILKQLNLDPNTAPEAWLTIAACGSNASALNQDELTKVIKQGIVKEKQLDAISRQKLQNQIKAEANKSR